MPDLFVNHIVGFPTRRLISVVEFLKSEVKSHRLSDDSSCFTWQKLPNESAFSKYTEYTNRISKRFKKNCVDLHSVFPPPSTVILEI